jgi:uncharacterized RDD family membrane protein YckC
MEKLDPITVGWVRIDINFFLGFLKDKRILGDYFLKPSIPYTKEIGIV